MVPTGFQHLPRDLATECHNSLLGQRVCVADRFPATDRQPGPQISWVHGRTSPHGAQECVPNFWAEDKDGTGSILTVTNADRASHKMSNLDAFSVWATVRAFEPPDARWIVGHRWYSFAIRATRSLVSCSFKATWAIRRMASVYWETSPARSR